MSRGSLTTRRGFFGLFTSEGRGVVEAAKGNLPLRLSDVPALPDHRLALIRPVLAPGVRLIAGEREVAARIADRDGIVLFPRGGIEERICARFDGDHDLAEIADELASTTTATAIADEDEAFAGVRDLFLRLLALGICVPANPIGSGG